MSSTTQGVAPATKASQAEPSNQQLLADRGTASNEAATKLIESIDDFLGDIEKKFKTISTEIFARLDDMTERCDRLEQDMLLGGGTTASGGDTGSNVETINGTNDGITHAGGGGVGGSSDRGRNGSADGRS